MRVKRGSEQVWRAEKLKQFPHPLRGGGRESQVLPQDEGGDLDEGWQDSGLLLELQE